jgi:hypothetical protein
VCIYNILVPFKPFFYIKVINLYVRNVRFYIAVSALNQFVPLLKASIGAPLAPFEKYAIVPAGCIGPWVATVNI